jgi:hypothetical protein
LADPDADVYPIQALLDQGCDLEADILPIVAREVPDLPRPLKNWGAPWLLREILAAREQRLAGHPVEAPPPARRTPAIEWDEFVAGHRAGLIEWNTARLSSGRGGQGSARRRRRRCGAAPFVTDDAGQAATSGDWITPKCRS